MKKGDRVMCVWEYDPPKHYSSFYPNIGEQYTIRKIEQNRLYFDEIPPSAELIEGYDSSYFELVDISVGDIVIANKFWDTYTAKRANTFYPVGGQRLEVAEVIGNGGLLFKDIPNQYTAGYSKKEFQLADVSYRDIDELADLLIKKYEKRK